MSEIYCSNCEKKITIEDKYCRYCGVAVTQTDYKPNFRGINVIYGPMPVKRKHLCSKCAYAWTTHMMVDNQKFCPVCGGDAPVVFTDDF